jgi:aryl-alcohol dehydrogenase-like predicted oxidoreductase
MKYRRLGTTDINVSVVGMGTFQFGGTWGKQFAQSEVEAMIAEGRRAGINLIDTAECYGDHLAEKMIGPAIKADRERWVVASKFGHRRINLFDRRHLWSVEDVQKQLEDSLKALQTDYIDLYQFHSGSNEVFDNDRLWEMLNKQVEAGKIRYLGISISTHNEEYQNYQTENAGKVGARAIQVRYNRLVKTAEKTVLPLCQNQGLGVLARVPLESGLLSGKFGPETTFGSNDVRSKKYDAATLKQMLTAVSKIKEREIPKGIPISSWSLGWCLLHPAVSCVIPGGKTPEHIRLNASAADLDMVSSGHPLSVGFKL